MMRVWLIAMLIAATWLADAASADAVRDLYFAQTVVTGIEEPERTRGLREALTEVVIKLTGDPRLAGAKRLAPLLENPAALVERFTYEDRMKDLPVRDEQGTRERPHILRVWFKPEATDKALAELGLRHWSIDRPPVAKDAPWVGPPLIEDAQAAHSLADKVAQDGAALIGTLTVRDDGTWRSRWWLAGKKSPPKPLAGADAEGVSFDIALKRAIDAAVLAFSS